MDFPPDIETVLEQLKVDPSVRSIWFIGSRANGNYRPDSDWDFICFCDVPVQVRQARCSFVDIVQVGNDGAFLLEGQPIHKAGRFTNWQWIDIDSSNAQYKNRVPPDVPSGIAYDLNSIKVVTYSAFKVWERNA